MNQSLEFFCLSKNQLWFLWSKLYTLNLWEIGRFVKEPTCELGTRSTTTIQLVGFMQRRCKAPHRQAFAVPPRLAQDAGGRVQQRRGCRLLALTDTSSISPFTSMILKALATMTILTLAMTFTLANAMFSAVSNKAQQPGVERVRCWVRIQAGYDLKTLLVGILDITNVVLLNAE